MHHFITFFFRKVRSWFASYRSRKCWWSGPVQKDFKWLGPLVHIGHPFCHCVLWHSKFTFYHTPVFKSSLKKVSKQNKTKTRYNQTIFMNLILQGFSYFHISKLLLTDLSGLWTSLTSQTFRIFESPAAL